MTSSLITTVGGDYDQQVHQWKQHIVSELESTRESEVNTRHQNHITVLTLVFIGEPAVANAVWTMCG